ncbi:MAG: polysaccharide biosynthesis protein [Clostridium sp.]|uniref:putative polysaccharide biosynthesis protein n=1 Tax=Clostridium sp. TaxID=1506 RepID=UPI001EBC342B|nr:polysaccharide biosynthesis protein [Clostridium sp.]MBS5885875.1 polysaccharide biosynthesis protein [Clostridium sp.]MDU7149829.1 polysaccharide biosynthesis protein [Clostridium sp.]MDU7242306.1 polysaccharide biosynthesis protein [Clostridium sp.]
MEERSAGRGFLILSIAGIAGKLLSAIYVPLLTAVLGETGYGIYVAGYDIFVFLIAVTSLGAQPAVTKVVTELRAMGNHKDALRAMKLAIRYLAMISIVIAGVFMVLAFPLSKVINAEQSALTFVFLGPAIIFAAILAAYRGYMQAVEEMEALAISQIIEQLINVVLSLVFAGVLIAITSSDEWGSAGGTVGTSLGAIVAIIYIIYIYEKRNYKEEAERNHDPSRRRVSDKKIVKKLFMYAIPITLVAGVQNFAGVIDTMTLGKSLSSAGFNQSQVNDLRAVLSYYKTLIYVPLAIVTALGTSIFPRVIQAFVHKNRKELKQQTSYAFRIMYIIVIPAVFGLSILSKEIYKFLFPSSTGYYLLMYGSTLLIFMAITTIQNVILQGINKLYLIIFSASAGLVAKIIINIILVPIPNINIKGAVVATFVSFIIPAVINHRKIERFFKVRIPIIRQAIVPTICSMLMAIVIFLVKFPVIKVADMLGGGRVIIAIATLVLIGIGGIVYLYTMVYFGGIRKKDLDLISPRVFRFLPRSLRKELI